MKSADVQSVLRDKQARVTYKVLAYRKLTPRETADAVRYYLARKKKKPKAGTTVTIMTIIGYDDDRR